MSNRLRLLPPLLFLMAVLGVVVFLVSITPPYVPEPTPPSEPEPAPPRKPLYPGLIDKTQQEVVGLVGLPDRMTGGPGNSTWYYPDGEIHFGGPNRAAFRVVSGK